MRSWTRPAGRGEWLAASLGLLILLIGVILVFGGIQLIEAGGSWFYFLIGLVLTASGLAMMQRLMVGAWLYAAAFVLTAIWAFWEAGLDGWPLVPRLVGPFILLLLVIAAMPVFDRERGRRLRMFGLGAWAVAVVVLGVAIAQANQPPDADPMPVPIRTAMGDASPLQAGADWPYYGATQNVLRYSPLEQITPDNVRQLERAWVFQTGDTPEERWGAETTPIKIGDWLYLCTSRSMLIGLDAATGEERWRYDPQVSDLSIPYTAACRGVSYHARPGADPSQPCATRVIGGTLDARLIAVDARTGRPCADFGDNGAVDITVGMGEVPPSMVSITSPPVIVRGVIVTGQQVLDGQLNDAPSGVVQAFDVTTGELRWAWDMEHPERTGRPPEGETYARGTPNMWTIATADEALGLVYLPMGNSAADYWSGDRSEAENQYATSLVALNVETGRVAWSFQTVHMDVWDYDLGSQPTLIDFPTDSGVVPAVLLASKQGEIYVLDRRTGEPLVGVEERRVPGGGLEPELRTPTQPFSSYHSLRRPDLRERDMWGMSLIDQMICRIQFRRATYDGIYTPPTTSTRWIQYPGYNGGSDWGGISVDPRRGVIIANYNDTPNYNRLVPRDEAERLGWQTRGSVRGGSMSGDNADQGDPQMGVPFAIDVNAGWRLPSTNLLCKEPPYGGIRAIDLRTGRTIWDRDFGSARRNGPWGIPSMLPLTIGTPNNGGPALTASGLIFIGATTDNLLRAIDIETGRTLWQDVLPAGGQATPMIYEANGRQFVVIIAGGHHFMETPPGDYVIAYALPTR